MEFLNNHHVKRFIRESFGVILAGLAVVYANEPMYIALIPILNRARSMVFRYFGIENN